jgi:hypothetical protein
MFEKNVKLTRRRFLKRAAFMAAAPYVVPASALGRGGRVAPSERILLGGIGIGSRGSHADSIGRDRDWQSRLTRSTLDAAGGRCAILGDL